MARVSADDSTDPGLGDPVLWYVAHTRPRCEKKVAQYCTREHLPYSLPLYRSVKKYRGKTVCSEKVLFPGYIFLRVRRSEARKVGQNDYVASLLHVHDQEEFQEQLGQILTALEHEVEIMLAPHITTGVTVRIKSGPLRGLEGLVENRSGNTQVILRLDFIKQAAAVRVEASDLELA
jgi:transcription antitermination factor NusG